MATEDDYLEGYAEIQERMIAARIQSKPASPETECIDCGDEIPPLRKAAVPSTQRCIECEELFTKKNR